MLIEDIGYNEYFENLRQKSNFKDFPVARVTSEQKGIYTVVNDKGEFSAKVRGKRMFTAGGREDYPAVGDWVLTSINDKEHATIEEILPRRTILKRRYGDKNKSGEKTDMQLIGTNIDVAFIVQSVGVDYSLNRFERYITIAESGGVLPVIILNKIDTIEREKLNLILEEIKERFKDIEVITTSVINEEGLNELSGKILKGQTYCFLGSSGVGKSSLINKLIGENLLDTGEISEHNGKGKHVTITREMYFLKNGGIVIDNPGVREVGMTDVSSGINSYFDEIESFASECKYSDCTHTNEPGCGVLKAIKSGVVSEEQYSNYLTLKKEVEFYEMTDLEKREKKRNFGKFVNKIKKDLKRYEW